MFSIYLTLLSTDGCPKISQKWLVDTKKDVIYPKGSLSLDPFRAPVQRLSESSKLTRYQLTWLYCIILTSRKNKWLCTIQLLAVRAIYNFIKHLLLYLDSKSSVIELPCHFGFAATKETVSLAAGTFCSTNGYQPEITKPNGGVVTGLPECER